jgi:hypothetical protein
MATPSLRFRKMFSSYTPADRATILNTLTTWATGIQTIIESQHFCNFLYQLQGVLMLPKKELESHHTWLLANALNVLRLISRGSQAQACDSSREDGCREDTCPQDNPKEDSRARVEA